MTHNIEKASKFQNVFVRAHTRAIFPDILDVCATVLTEETTQARQMLRSLLRGRLVFTPDLERNACEFVGEGDLSAVFSGLVDLPKALASPTGFEPVFWP